MQPPIHPVGPCLLDLIGKSMCGQTYSTPTLPRASGQKLGSPVEEMLPQPAWQWRLIAHGPSNSRRHGLSIVARNTLRARLVQKHVGNDTSVSIEAEAAAGTEHCGHASPASPQPAGSWTYRGRPTTKFGCNHHAKHCCGRMRGLSPLLQMHLSKMEGSQNT